MYYCIRVLYLTCPRIDSFVFGGHGEGWRNTERRSGIAVEIKSSLSFILTSRTSSMPVAFRINTSSVSSCINIDRVKRKERVMYVHTYIYSRADAVRLHTAWLDASINPSFPLPLPQLSFESMSGHYAFVRTAFDFGAWQQGRADSLIMHEQHLPIPNILPIKLSTECPKVVASKKSSDLCIVQCLLCVIRTYNDHCTRIHPYSYLSYIPTTQKPLCTTIGANMRTSLA